MSGISMRRLVDQSLKGQEDGQANVKIYKEALSDGSYVYDLEIGSFIVPCTSEEDARKRFGLVTQAADLSDGGRNV